VEGSSEEPKVHVIWLKQTKRTEAKRRKLNIPSPPPLLPTVDNKQRGSFSFLLQHRLATKYKKVNYYLTYIVLYDLMSPCPQFSVEIKQLISG